MWNWLMETWNMPKELGLFYNIFLPFPSYTPRDQLIICQATFAIPYHWYPLSISMFINILSLNLFNIVILYTLKVFLGG